MLDKKTQTWQAAASGETYGQNKMDTYMIHRNFRKSRHQFAGNVLDLCLVVVNCSGKLKRVAAACSKLKNADSFRDEINSLEEKGKSGIYSSVGTTKGGSPEKRSDELGSCTKAPLREAP